MDQFRENNLEYALNDFNAALNRSMNFFKEVLNKAMNDFYKACANAKSAEDFEAAHIKYKLIIDKATMRTKEFDEIAKIRYCNTLDAISAPLSLNVHCG